MSLQYYKDMVSHRYGVSYPDISEEVRPTESPIVSHMFNTGGVGFPIHYGDPWRPVVGRSNAWLTYMYNDNYVEGWPLPNPPLKCTVTEWDLDNRATHFYTHFSSIGEIPQSGTHFKRVQIYETIDRAFYKDYRHYVDFYIYRYGNDVYVGARSLFLIDTTHVPQSHIKSHVRFGIGIKIYNEE